MRKLATACFSFAAAIFFSRYLLPYNWLPYCCAVSAGLSLTGLFLRGRLRLRIFISLLSLAAGFVWSWMYTAVFIAPAGELHGETATVSAVASNYPSATTRGYRVDGMIIRGGGPSIGAGFIIITRPGSNRAI